MKTLALCVVLLIVCFTPQVLAQPSVTWVNAYYTDWDYQRMPPSAIDFRGLTNIIFINLDPIGSPPYFQFHWPGQQVFEATAADLIARAHANGVKVLLGLGGVWCSGDCGGNAFLNHANDPVWVHNYVTAVLNYARSKGYDGVSLDWEGSVFREGWIRLTDSLRAGLNRWNPRGKFSAAIAGMIQMGWNNPYDIAALNRNIDYIESMTFDLNGYWSGASGFNSPLYDPTPNWPGYRGDNVHQSSLNWIARGVEPAKFATGIPFYGFKWWGITAPGQTGWSNSYFTRYHFVLREDLGKGVLRRDTQSKTPWISKVNGQLGSNETAYIDYHDSQAVTEKVNYALQQGHGGIMVFDLNSGYLDPQNYPNVSDRNPLQTAMRVALGSTSLQPPDILPRGFVLEQNFPNPFNPTTTIRYALAEDAVVTLKVYNMIGQEVVTLLNEPKQAGTYEVTFEARNNRGDALTSGVYFYEMKAGGYSETKKMVLLQ
ncbi:T9SS type A sorting domain-containing protein [Sphingobacteriales bacterium CHB3]|nr:T9SS type A sorting domain-containing protein [Sphingobacteriales bacterium CHB3]